MIAPRIPHARAVALSRPVPVEVPWYDAAAVVVALAVILLGLLGS